MALNKKKTVLITGAGQGIGQSIAFRFAADGSNIVIASKDKWGCSLLINSIH